MGKIRRIDFHPDEFLAGVIGMSPDDIGVFWTLCTRMYSAGGPIPNDAEMNAEIFSRKTRPSTIRASIDRLVAAGKLFICASDGDPNGVGFLYQRRCQDVINSTRSRIEGASTNGKKGGRPRRNINSLEKGSGFHEGFDTEKGPLTTNLQPPTYNHNTPYSPPPEGGGSPDGEHTDRDLLGNTPAKKSRRKRGEGADCGTRVPEGDLPEEWAVAANHSRERHELPLLNKRVLSLRWTSFQNFWRGRPGSKGLKSDWRATWLNDCIDNRTEKRFPPEGVVTARAPMIDTTG